MSQARRVSCTTPCFAPRGESWLCMRESRSTRMRAISPFGTASSARDAARSPPGLTRATVRCARNGRFSSTNPAERSPPARHAARSSNSRAPCSAPTHRTRGRRASGNEPAPERVRSNAGNAAQGAAASRSRGRASSGCSPRNARVKCNWSSFVQESGASPAARFIARNAPDDAERASSDNGTLKKSRMALEVTSTVRRRQARRIPAFPGGRSALLPCHAESRPEARGRPRASAPAAADREAPLRRHVARRGVRRGVRRARHHHRGLARRGQGPQRAGGRGHRGGRARHPRRAGRLRLLGRPGRGGALAHGADRRADRGRQPRPRSGLALAHPAADVLPGQATALGDRRGAQDRAGPRSKRRGARTRSAHQAGDGRLCRPDPRDPGRQYARSPRRGPADLCRLGVSCVAFGKGGERRTGFYGGGRRVDFRFFEDFSPAEVGREAARQAIATLGAIPAPAGPQTVVLAPGWSGILLHEAVGHGLEADFIRKGTSLFAGKLGEKVASELVTVIDDGTVAGGRGSLNVDDEGNPGERKVLIEKGVLKGYLYDHLNAKLTGQRSTGSGRSAWR